MPGREGQPSALAVLFDGAWLSEDEARALWVRFSAHMDAHEGDLAGFARANGWHSVSPEYRNAQAVLVVRTMPGAPTKAATASAGAKPKPRGARRPAKKARGNRK